MKKVLSLILMFSAWVTISQAQTTFLAKRTFPSGTSTDALPDQASVNNATKSISTEGGVSAIDFSKNGATTTAAQATGWDNGANVKFWQIEINSTGFHNLTFNSKVSTGGTFPGPRDFKAQYKVSLTGIWADIDSGSFITTNNWTTGVLNGIELPGECDAQSSVFIRWIMTSDTANNGTIVFSTGICKIDDINVAGEKTVSINGNKPETVFQLYPNPSTGIFTILKNKQTDIIEIYNILGNKVYECLNPVNQVNVDLSIFGKGVYILRSGNNLIQKIMIK